jgi:hypothetical protein
MGKNYPKPECQDEVKDCHHYVDNPKKTDKPGLCYLLERNDPFEICEFLGLGYNKCKFYCSNWLLGKQYKDKMRAQREAKGTPTK